MTTSEQPLTREDLREELKHYATKADLAELKSELTWRLAGLQIASMVAIAAILRFLA